MKEGGRQKKMKGGRMRHNPNTSFCKRDRHALSVPFSAPPEGGSELFLPQCMSLGSQPENHVHNLIVE